jgi:anti-anti-sigma factor
VSELNLHVSRRDGVVSLSLVGPLHQPTVFALRRVLREHQDEHVRLNLKNCVFIDLDGLMALAVAQRVARARGGSVTVSSVPPLIEDRIRRAHLDHLIEAGRTADEA